MQTLLRGHGVYSSASITWCKNLEQGRQVRLAPAQPSGSSGRCAEFFTEDHAISALLAEPHSHPVGLATA